MVMRMSHSVFIALFASMALIFASGVSYAQKPTIGKPCIQCHEKKRDVVRGKMGTRSEKFSTMQVKVGKLIWVIKYDRSTSVKGARNLTEIPKGKEIAVTFTGDTKTALAKNVSVKQPYQVPAEQLLSLDEMKKYVAMGPEKGNYVLFDSRPKPKYLEGHIPHALSLPYAAFDKLQAKVLPKDKNTLLIFYCGGKT